MSITFGDFEKLQLHDATLVALHMTWGSGTCTLIFNTAAGVVNVTFAGVTSVAAPRRLPWGPSVSVNKQTQPLEGVFEVEMQSGDVIAINAAGYSLHAL